MLVPTLLGAFWALWRGSQSFPAGWVDDSSREPLLEAVNFFSGDRVPREEPVTHAAEHS